MDTHGSPINVLDVGAMRRNAGELLGAARGADVDLQIYFARKANKALAFVDEAQRLGLGIDLASRQELEQVLDRGVSGERLVMTAAVKPHALLELCVRSGTTVVVDNRDELHALADVAGALGRPASIALRLAPALASDRPPTRFGFAFDDAVALLDQDDLSGAATMLALVGVHFHLDGYDASERATAIGQALELIDALRERGHAPTFIDIGGGVPISYIDEAGPWERFWSEHERALLGERAPLTFDGHGLGLLAHDGQLVGRRAVYPYHQSPTRGEWLAQVLAAPLPDREHGRCVAAGVRERGLAMRCEPGRALVDGCGLTAARVAHRKQCRDGSWLVSVEMNRTQCRSTSEDFMVDPLLLCPHGADLDDGPASGPIEGFLVGAYCIERELLTWRRMRFPRGVHVGDIVVFPNTAGYQMHILESSSHQMPLARNLVCRADDEPPLLDGIDLQAPSRAHEGVPPCC
jgi:diaminopimelate decarboxylase